MDFNTVYQTYGPSHDNQKVWGEHSPVYMS
jgi:hypothetical protein